MAVVSEMLHKWWHLLFEAPPPPPNELIEARRELRTAVVQARLAARQHRRAARDMVDRLGEVTDMIHNGDGR